MLAERGAVVISADEVARHVLDPGTDASVTVLALWPGAGSDGVVDRARLGRIVFSDPAELAALETITHPATRSLIVSQVASHPDETVVVEIPLLRDWFDDEWVRVVVDAPDAVRVQRVLDRDSDLSADDVRTIMARQATRQQWLMAADYVLDNGGGLAELDRQAARVWALIHDA
jgi:dephospho-CoA kinase